MHHNKRLVRGNNSPFMNKTLSKAVMNRSRLRNKFIKNPSLENKGIAITELGYLEKKLNHFIITWTPNSLQITENSGKLLNHCFRTSISVIIKSLCLRGRKLYPMIMK